MSDCACGDCLPCELRVMRSVSNIRKRKRRGEGLSPQELKQLRLRGVEVALERALAKIRRVAA